MLMWIVGFVYLFSPLTYPYPELICERSAFPSRRRLVLGLLDVVVPMPINSDMRLPCSNTTTPDNETPDNLSVLLGARVYLGLKSSKFEIICR